MKMHKKLFGLLATAAVGLTLTSCGGGGGGGGGSAPAETPDSDKIYEGTVYSPVSLADKSMNNQTFQAKNGATMIDFSFLSGGVVFVSETYSYPELGQVKLESEGTYTYTRDAVNPNKVKLSIDFKFCNVPGEDKNNDGIYKEKEGEVSKVQPTNVEYELEYTGPGRCSGSRTFEGEIELNREFFIQ